MKLSISAVFLFFFVVGIYAADLELPTVSPKTQTDLPLPKIWPWPTKKTTTTTSSSTESTSTSTTAPITTTQSTTSEAPTSPTTTTQSTTSEAPAPPTTTTQSTTSEAPTTTSKPVPAPIQDPERGTWSLFDEKTNTTCIIVALATQLNITYTTADEKLERALYNIPVNKTSLPNGHCGSDTQPQSIVVGWTTEKQNKTNSFALTFQLNGTTQEFSLIEAVYEIFAGDLPNGNNDTLKFYYVGSAYATPKDLSYHCTKVQSLNLTASEDTKVNVGEVKVSKVQLEAYHKGRNSKFSTASDCDAINTPDIVPIAVGIALIALVIIVLVAYLVGRRRAQARGYVSM